ncbi:MAG: nuclear transport factor 2 family protein [Tepidisphaeraceae bacterium]
MSIQAVARKFVEMCNAGKNFEVMQTMYAPDIVSVEGDGKETVGQEAVIKKSADWAGTLTFHGEKVLGPYFNGPNQFAVHFTLDITRTATGQRVQLTEVGVYTVNTAGLITREVFYYDGDH